MAVFFLWVLGGLLGFLLLFLCMPIGITGRFANLDISELDGVNLTKLTWQTEVAIFQGLLKLSIGRETDQGDTLVQLHVLGYKKRIKPKRRSPDKGKDRKDRKDRTETTHKKRSAKARRSNVGFGQVRHMVPEVRRLAKDLWHALHLHGRGYITYGFPDPYITGLSQAVLSSVKRPKELILQPDYLQGTLRGWAEASIKIYPIQSVWIVFRTAFRPAVRTLWWPHVRSALRWSKAS